MDKNFIWTKEFYLVTLDIMKRYLDLAEFKFDKKSNEFKFMKKQIMNIVYGSLKVFYQMLVKKDLAERCSCKANLRQGYTKCEFCSGCGYIEKIIKR